jgi:hypothetical protein
MTKYKSTVANLVNYLDFICPLDGSQCKADAIYSDLNTASDIASQTLLLHKLGPLGLYSGDVN